jgi:hypothetical protein
VYVASELVCLLADTIWNEAVTGSADNAVPLHADIPYTGAATFSFKQLLSCTHEAEWTPFRTHYFSENLVAPEIEPRPQDL